MGIMAVLGGVHKNSIVDDPPPQPPQSTSLCCRHASCVVRKDIYIYIEYLACEDENRTVVALAHGQEKIRGVPYLGKTKSALLYNDTQDNGVPGSTYFVVYGNAIQP